MIIAAGLCLEKCPVQSSSKFKMAEREDHITKSFELAADLTLLYLQELDKLQQQTNTNTVTSTGITVFQ